MDKMESTNLKRKKTKMERKNLRKKKPKQTIIKLKL